MPRVIGIDPGTLSVDVCGLDDGRLFLDRSIPTADALADPAVLLSLIESHAPLDLVAGPSGYGLPLLDARAVTEEDLALAALAPRGERGGIAGLRRLMRALAGAAAPVIFTPGVVHLPTVPPHRKLNRVDMGTADKVCAAALAIHEQCSIQHCRPDEVSCVLLELGGAFSAALAIAGGRIIDGAGGSSGPLGIAASGALDGEVAFLAGAVDKPMIFRGGVTTIAPGDDPFEEGFPRTARGQVAWQGYVESAVRAAVTMAVSVGRRTDVVLSGRVARTAWLSEPIEAALREAGFASSHTLRGFAAVAKQAAQGAALVADGLMGGASSLLVEAMNLRGATGTVLDHLHVVSRDAALARLGISG
jgi:predicted butyrate kinase (DUF1464 family)